MRTGHRFISRCSGFLVAVHFQTNMGVKTLSGVIRLHKYAMCSFGKPFSCIFNQAIDSGPAKGNFCKRRTKKRICTGRTKAMRHSWP